MISTAVMIQLEHVKGNKVANMQLINQKLVDRGTCMLIGLLELDYGKAKNLLLLHDSVEEVLQEIKLSTKDG